MEWSIQEVAKMTGTTSRTLRHYGEVGLLTPARIGRNGYRFYDRDALVQLQRILLLRGLGLSLPVIKQVLTEHTDVDEALQAHIGWLHQERERIGRQIASVERTLAAVQQGEELTMETMFDGFDHHQYEDEVRQRWGDDAWRRSTQWWTSLSAAEQQAFKQRAAQVNGALREAAEAGHPPDSEPFQRAVEAHHTWLGEASPHDPAATTRERYLCLADMYVADDRFAAVYGGRVCAERIREAVGVWVERNL